VSKQAQSQNAFCPISPRFLQQMHHTQKLGAMQYHLYKQFHRGDVTTFGCALHVGFADTGQVLKFL
jgi:hypothetical protein